MTGGFADEAREAPDAAETAEAAETEDTADTAEGADEQLIEEQRVRRPGELWRIAGSLSAVSAEIAEIESLDDDALCARLAELERAWRDELGAVLPEAVVAELHEYFDWFDEAPPRASEVRIGLAQLMGWLDGLISGINVSIGGQAEP